MKQLERTKYVNGRWYHIYECELCGYQTELRTDNALKKKHKCPAVKLEPIIAKIRYQNRLIVNPPVQELTITAINKKEYRRLMSGLMINNIILSK